MPAFPGKLIVIEGMDGSGKATQTKILAQKLKDLNKDVEICDFPQYGNWSAAFVEKYLNGEFGSAKEVGPYQASVFFAVDRYAQGPQMKQWLEQGKIIISNRYVSANQGHQGGKIKNPEERKNFFDWLDHLEYQGFQIPRPDLIIFLHVPPEIGQQLVDKKGQRDYVGGQKRDIHEADLQHLKDAEDSFLFLAENYPNWIKIDCTQDNQILSREEIHQKVWETIQEII
ncbi:dTMP kinase [Nanoarchaeota archaeon]